MSRRTHVIISDITPSRTSPTYTGVGRVVSIPERGVFDPQRPCKSRDNVQARFGGRQLYSVFADWCDLFYGEGGRDLHVIPVRGPSAAPATLNVPGTTGTTLTATVTDPKTGLPDHGEWGNSYSVQVINGPSGGTHRVLVVLYAGTEVGRSDEFNDRAAMNGVFIDRVKFGIAGGSGLPPVAAATNLAGGTLDRSNITQTQIDAAIDQALASLGPGQIAAPDWPTDATHDKLMAIGRSRNLLGVPDSTDTASKSTVLTLAGGSQGDLDGPYAAGIMHPWVVIKGTANLAERYVPASAFFMAKCNQVDAAAGPGQAPAGSQYGVQTSSLVTGLRATYSDADAAELEQAGVNLLIVRNGEVIIDGNRTLVDPAGPDSEWQQIGVCRLRMAIVASLNSTGETFEHLQITRANISKLDSAVRGVMMQFETQLFESEDDPGWVVDTGDAVNTTETIAAGELHADVGFRPAPGADMVIFRLSLAGIGQPVA